MLLAHASLAGGFATNRVVEFGSHWDFDPPPFLSICEDTNLTVLKKNTKTNSLCGPAFAATRSWKLRDKCGNIFDISQTVNVVDTRPPVVNCPPGKAVGYHEHWDFDTPEAYDEASGTDISITILDTTTNNVCGQSYEVTRLWKVKDTCTNYATCSQTIVVYDDTPPSLTCSSNRTVDFGTPWSFDPPTVEDELTDTNVTVAVLETVTNQICGNSFFATRTWIAFDNCTNYTTCSQTITVLDALPPIITCASNRVVEFGADWTFDAPTAVDAIDGSSVPIVVTATTTNQSCGGSYEATRTWLAVDSCSNSASCSQTISVVDTTPPSIVCSSNLLLEFGTAWSFSSPLASDACSGTNVTVTEFQTETNALCGNTYEATRTWLATDACGNSNFCSQTVTLLDTTPPIVACASNVTVEFGGSWSFTAPTAYDDCNGTNVVVTEVATTTNTLCANSMEITRTWLATDPCSNSVSCIQQITILDTTAPTFLAGTNRNVECGSEWSFDEPIVNDPIDGTNFVIEIVNTTTNAACGSTYSATRTWLISDVCSNSTTVSQTITMVDTTPPTLVCASNRVVECGEVWNFDPPQVFDGCSGTNLILEIAGTVTNHLPGMVFSATRSWVATDACNNSNTCAQTISVMDSTPPVVFCPSNIVLECDGSSGGIVVEFNTTALDGCDTNVTLVCTPPSGSLFGPGTNLVVCTATDSFGNSNQCSFTVSILDTTPPTITCPTNLIVSESPPDSGGAVVSFEVTANDTCEGTPTVVTEPASGSVFPIGTTVVHSMAADSSGNTNSCSFEVEVVPYRLFVNSTNDSGPGTLRDAISRANTTPDPNLLEFDFPEGSAVTIHALSALPPIVNPLIIDGWSQAGFSNRPIIEVNGSLAGTNIDGLLLSSPSNTVRGLVLNGFAIGIHIATNGGNIIQGNVIGSDIAGTTAVPNGQGILIQSDHNLIGGPAPAAANLIGGNAGNGIVIQSAQAHHNVVQGNFIGSSWDPYSALPNGHNGVLLMDGAWSNTIGDGNRVAYNGAAGIVLTPLAGTGNLVTGNSIEGNGGPGIDLGDDGPSPGDSGDGDDGPNLTQNFPVLSDAVSENGMTTISGYLNSIPSRTYRIEFFLNSSTNASGYSEGQLFIGFYNQYVHSDGFGDFIASLPVASSAGQFITATATDPEGNTSEFSPPVSVRTPPVITSQPTNTFMTAGSNYTICVTATGSEPLYYQWQRNGQNIPGETNACYTITAAEYADGGNYAVLVRNDLGVVGTYGANLILPHPSLGVGDNFVDRVPLLEEAGVVSGANRGATFEFGEPIHAGKPGGKSVWYEWSPPFNGIATFGTVGSDFDTLLAVYEGTNVAYLTPVAFDEDSGGYFTSGLRFNAFKNKSYKIAIDGYSGEEGDFLFNWSFEKTGHLLPIIAVPPQSQTVRPGDDATFTAVSMRVCGNGQVNCPNPAHYPDDELPLLDYQWLYNGIPIPGAISPTLVLSNVQPSAVGNYSIQVSMRERTVESAPASLQMNITDGIPQFFQAFDKFQDAFNSTPLVLGGTNAPGGPLNAGSIIVSGYSGSQVFNTTSGTSQGEVFCGEVGGASEWIYFVAGQDGVLSVNTDGSSFDTLLAVVLSNLPPVVLACDNNSGLGGTNSSITVPVTAGNNYLIGVDGVNGAFGRVVLNYSLSTPNAPEPEISDPGTTSNGLFGFQISNLTNKFAVQVSTDLSTWTSLSTNNAPVYLYDFVDPRSTNFPKRFYRVQVVP